MYIFVYFYVGVVNGLYVQTDIYASNNFFC